MENRMGGDLREGVRCFVRRRESQRRSLTPGSTLALTSSRFVSERSPARSLSWPSTRTVMGARRALAEALQA